MTYFERAMRHPLPSSLFQTAAVAACLLFALPAWAGPYSGVWKTIDDETGKPKSKVELYEQDGKLFGKIIHLYRGPDEDQDPVCKECTDHRKGKKIKGMVIVTGLTPVKDYWGKGKVLDPGNGKEYGCTIWLEDGDPNTLNVRGDIGLSFLSRTQQWKRAE